MNINGIEQSPRKRILFWTFLRKNVNETSIGSIETDTIKVRLGLKDLNKAIWQSKLDYAQEFANATLLAQELLSQTHISSARNLSNMAVGESIELKKARLIAVAELAKSGIETNAIIAIAKIFEAKKLALLNGETIADIETIEEEARLKQIALNLTATEKKRIVDVELNSSLAELEASDDGIRFCLSDGTNCPNNQTTSNLTNYALKNQSETFAGDITTSQTGFFGWLGSLTSRITKLWVIDVNATGNIETSQNVSATYLKGDGSLLTNLPAGSGLTSIYLGSNLNATNVAYATIFTIPLTPNKMNIVNVYLAQSSSADGVAIHNRAIVNESGPIGNCKFTTQTSATTESVDNVAVSTTSVDTAENTMTLTIDVLFINTVSCAILADTNPKNLIIQFDSETVANVTTYMGSYYTSAVNQGE